MRLPAAASVLPLLLLIAGDAPADRRRPGGPLTGPEPDGLEPPWMTLDARPVPPRASELALPAELRRRADRPAVTRVRIGPTGNLAIGALSGKTVYLSAGHGWYWTGTRWTTQRGNTNGIVEDLSNVEAVNAYLAAYLRNMGARVVPIRELDVNPNRVIVDDGDATLEGGATEVASAAAGWGGDGSLASDGALPFAAGGTRLLETAAVESGRAVYAVAVPESGAYHVYVSYAAGADRAPDAHYVVRHAGGETHYLVDQRRHGGTWILLGSHVFEAGAGAERSSIAVANDSSAAASGARVSLDAVRVGGGLSPTERGGATSGRPAYEHAARYHAQFAGAPRAVYDARAAENDDDVVTRSLYTAWDHEEGEDAVYVSWHSNAPNPARGTDTYVYGDADPPGPLSAYAGVEGSLELAQAVHAEMMADVKAAWDPEWHDRGIHTAWFGELNPARNPEVPGILVEIAFHDTPADADCIRDPRFRRIIARGLAQGIVKYYETRDGVDLALAPEPPAAARIENVQGPAGPALRVSWRPPAADPAGGDAPDGYRVYLSRDGRAFDDGSPTTDESLLLADVRPGEAWYARVTAENAGGESMPTEVVGARVAPSGGATVLVVGGFDRIDGHMVVREDLSAYGLGQVDRAWPDRLNDGAYAARHGAAIEGAGYSFDGAADEAIGEGDVDLARYQAVDWFLGEESSAAEIFGAAAREAVTRYLAGGGRLLVTGSEIGWALVEQGSAEEQAFFADVLHAAYVGDDAGTYAVTAAAEGPYAGLADLAFDDHGAGSYDADWPDVLAAGTGAALVLSYGAGAGGAAIAWGAGAPGERGVHLGFPFETIAGADVRREVMARTLAFFEVEEAPGPPDGGLPAADGGGAGTDGGVGDGGDGGGGDGDGCGCRAGGRDAADARGPAAAAVLVLALALARAGARRRRQARRP